MRSAHSRCETSVVLLGTQAERTEQSPRRFERACGFFCVRPGWAKRPAASFSPLASVRWSKVSFVDRAAACLPFTLHNGGSEALGAVAPILEFLPRNPGLHNELAQVRSGDDPAGRPSGSQLLARFLPDSVRSL